METLRLMADEHRDAHADVESRELFARIARGAPGSLARLYETHGARLHGYARALVRREADADEALQEVFLGLAKARGGLARIESPTAYLFRATRHAALAILRARERSQAALESVAEPLVRGRDASVAAEEVDEANALLAALPPEQREVVVLKVYSGLTFAEIAELTGVSLNTAASRYRHALEKLRARKGGEP